MPSLLSGASAHLYGKIALSSASDLSGGYSQTTGRASTSREHRSASAKSAVGWHWPATSGLFFDVAAHHVMASASGSACTYASEVRGHRTSKPVRVPSARFRERSCSKAHSVSSVSMAVADLARCAKHAMPSPARAHLRNVLAHKAGEQRSVHRLRRPMRRTVDSSLLGHHEASAVVACCGWPSRPEV